MTSPHQGLARRQTWFLATTIVCSLPIFFASLHFHHFLEEIFPYIEELTSSGIVEPRKNIHPRSTATKMVILESPDQSRGSPSNFSSMEAQTNTSVSRPIPTTTSSTTEKRKIIEPPFHIVQIGKPRSGSTFQFVLLKAIVALKMPPPQIVISGYRRKVPKDEMLEMIRNETSFVFKTHLETTCLAELHEEGLLTIFSSGGLARQVSLYNQKKESLYNCSLCEIEKYRPFFGLTDEQVHFLTVFMQQYSILRQCCSPQMSRYERQRLNGCNMTKYEHLKEYPHCEKHDLQSVEDDLFASRIGMSPFVTENGRFASVRNCIESRSWMSQNNGFNGRRFEGCDS